jgi:hypothetical protein
VLVILFAIRISYLPPPPPPPTPPKRAKGRLRGKNYSTTLVVVGEGSEK